jgi:hypothetical protein
MIADELKAILLAVLTALSFGALLYLRLWPRKRHRARHAKTYSAWSGGAAPRPRLVPQATLPAPDLPDPAQQLHAIARVDFECTPLLKMYTALEPERGPPSAASRIHRPRRAVRSPRHGPDQPS